MSKLLRYNTVTPNRITFAAADDLNNTFSHERVIQPKKAGALSVTNCKSIFKTNRFRQVVQPGIEAVASNREVLSAATTLSGSIENRAQLKQVWLDHHANIVLAIDAGALDGFLSPVATAFVTEVTE
ncbi:MAG: putative coat protein [Dirlevirus faecenecus]|uniref:Coat protein n=1 Tax=Leviviridae sp. TaxID=2027243 RepID=A0ABY3SU92_9VIRU|nr:MAG: putative coat protein [Leviviridae sp.]